MPARTYHATGRTSYRVRSSGRRSWASMGTSTPHARSAIPAGLSSSQPGKATPTRLQAPASTCEPFYYPPVDEALPTCAIEAMAPPRPAVLQEVHVVACYLSDSMPALPSSGLPRKQLGALPFVECQCRRRRGNGVPSLHCATGWHLVFLI